MNDDPSSPDEASLKPDSIPEAEIRAMLQRLLQSPDFIASRRCQDFLRFVVEQTLAGSQESLKERTIGVQVFGRTLTYDTNADGIVRIKASEVRKRLVAYYAGKGKDEGLRLELPVGSYVPLFHLLPPVGQPSPPGETIPVGETPSPGAPPERASSRTLWLFAGAAAIALLAIGMILARPHSHSALEQFWAPILDDPKPLMVASDYTPVYLLRPVVPGMPTHSESDYVPQTDQYLGGGDLVAASKVSAFLGQQNREFSVRVGKGVSFEDLRESPCVLIGYSITRWSQLTKDFRFSFDENGMVRDQGRPTPWQTRLTRDSHTDLDYAIVSRAYLPQTHACMILISGSTQYGTESAANLVTTPELMEEVMRSAPKDWHRKNLQLLLQVKVIANSPGTPTVIASHFW